MYDLPPLDFLNFMSLIYCLRTTCEQNMNAQPNVANDKNNKTIYNEITKTKQANKFLFLQQLNKRPKRACIRSTGLDCKLAAHTVLSTMTI